MFTIAGPVIVYGTVVSVVYGIIYWITTLFYEKGLPNGKPWGINWLLYIHNRYDMKVSLHNLFD